jgi:hypothetical protein
VRIENEKRAETGGAPLGTGYQDLLQFHEGPVVSVAHHHAHSDARHRVCRLRLQEEIVSSGYEITDGRFGSSPKDRWLAILSLLVCVVGIVNAQLMAVTERFREIGTFKCLGALNSFVVRIFVLEAVYQGLFGGFTGALLGIAIATISLSFKIGWAVLLSWPILGMLFNLIAASLLAVVLSLIGVIYPALVAARMQPAVALRAE